ncbi:MAG: hypothetical protein GY794_01540 [bacterium]|nr:hypothetical protein [bacterium]
MKPDDEAHPPPRSESALEDRQQSPADRDETYDAFLRHYQEIKNLADQAMPLSPNKWVADSKLTDWANYSLRCGGKRLRPVLAYAMCIDQYGLEREIAIAVMRMIEYIHTASIIFDDKPSQDNADRRRGKPTLHRHAGSEAAAELTGLFLVMRSVEQLSTLQGIGERRLLDAVTYLTHTVQAICEGQLLDLASCSQETHLATLEWISGLKTGLAIEVSMMVPAILAGADEAEKGVITDLARHFGLTFQIKDDLLDTCGDATKMGKPTAQDITGGRASFVLCLGEGRARELLTMHYLLARQLVRKLGGVGLFFSRLLDFAVDREC